MLEDIELKETEPRITVDVAREKKLERAATAPKEITSLADEETIRMLALAAAHPEWQAELFTQIERDKAPLSSESREKIMSFFAGENGPSEHETEIAEEVEVWRKSAPEATRRFEQLQQYFSPRERTSRVVMVPSDTILPPKGGHGFHVGDTTVIMSHAGAFDNADHEFLHGIVNTIVRKLLPNLTEENIRMISELASKNLVDDYGTPESILDEELIRTYNDYIKRGENPRTFPEFSNIVDAMTDEQFLTTLQIEPDTAERMVKMGISSLKNLRARTREYYDTYEKDVLRERIAKLYRKFEEEKKTNPDLSFEIFLGGNLRELFLNPDS
jgi:hypothetical protein